MNCLKLIDDIGRKLHSTILELPGLAVIPTKDYGWENHRYLSVDFRLAHVEIFNQDRFSVVHCCVFPWDTDPAPIFGFDVIGGESKITGVFMDLSPTIGNGHPFTDIDVGRSRDRPEWGDIFSEHWLACRPTPEEMVMIGNEAVRVLKEYLPTLGRSTSSTRDLIVSRQNRYCLQQQKNEHTRRALVNLLGPDGAEEFMSTVLFPTIS